MSEPVQNMLNAFNEKLKSKQKLDINDFIDWAIAEIEKCLPSEEEIGREWKNLLNDITKDKEVYIRGYGRDKDISNITPLYKNAGFKCTITKDKTNNFYPQELMKKMKNIKELGDYTLSHIWGFTKNIYLFCCPWNIVCTPPIIDSFTGHESKESDLKNSIQEQIYEHIFKKNTYTIVLNKYNNLLKTDPNILKLKKICLKNAIKAHLQIQCFPTEAKGNSDYKNLINDRTLNIDMLKQWQPLDDSNIFEKKSKKGNILDFIKKLTKPAFIKNLPEEYCKNWLQMTDKQRYPKDTTKWISQDSNYEWICNIIDAEDIYNELKQQKQP